MLYSEGMKKNARALRAAHHTALVRAGFTIVELLIVVVVIAILASITIVSYNGITKRAENALTLSLVKEWQTKLGIYNVERGSFPDGTYEYSCLTTADALSESTPFSDGQCMTAGVWGASADDTMMTDIKDTVGSVPSGLYRTPMILDSAAHRGLLYLSRNGGHGITFVLNGPSDECEIGTLYYEQNSKLVCRLVLDGAPYEGL